MHRGNEFHWEFSTYFFERKHPRPVGHNVSWDEVGCLDSQTVRVVGDTRSLTCPGLRQGEVATRVGAFPVGIGPKSSIVFLGIEEPILRRCRRMIGFLLSSVPTVTRPESLKGSPSRLMAERARIALSRR